jgi:hypothetical protein
VIDREPKSFEGMDTVTGMVAYRARTHRPTREVVASVPGIGAAGLVVWLAKLFGHDDLPPDVAVYIGSLVTSGVSWLIRSRLDRGKR